MTSNLRARAQRRRISDLRVGVVIHSPCGSNVCAIRLPEQTCGLKDELLPSYEARLAEVLDWSDTHLEGAGDFRRIILLFIENNGFKRDGIDQCQLACLKHTLI